VAAAQDDAACTKPTATIYENGRPLDLRELVDAYLAGVAALDGRVT